MKYILLPLVFLSFFNSIQAKEKQISESELARYINTCKQFSMEKITLQGDSIRTDYCMNSECSTFISWVFDLQHIKSITLKQDEEYFFLHFECSENDCIKPPVIGTVYSPKSEYDMYIKSKEEAEKLLGMLLQYQKKGKSK